MQQGVKRANALYLLQTVWIEVLTQRNTYMELFYVFQNSKIMTILKVSRHE